MLKNCKQSSKKLINGVVYQETYIQQLCADTGRSLEDLHGTMDDWDVWRRDMDDDDDDDDDYLENTSSTVSFRLFLQETKPFIKRNGNETGRDKTEVIYFPNYLCKITEE